MPVGHAHNTPVARSTRAASALLQTTSGSCRYDVTSGIPWHSSSRHEMYLGLNLLGMEKWAVFITAPLKRWYDSCIDMLFTGTHCQHTFVMWRTAPLHLNDYLKLICFLRNRTLSCGSIFRPVCFPEIPSTHVCWCLSWLVSGDWR